MGALAQGLDWTVLGGEPVPGDPAAVSAAAEAAHRGASRSAELTGEVGGLATTAAGGAWTGGVRDAFVRAAGQLPTLLDVLTRAGAAAADALEGFAELMATMQAQAAELLGVATDADTTRAAAEEALLTLHADLVDAEEAEASATAAWRQAQASADLALATGDPTVAALTSEARRLRVRCNDRSAEVARVRAAIGDTTTARTTAEETLEGARVDAERLAADFTAAAAHTAAALGPVPSAGRGLFAGLPGPPQPGAPAAPVGVAAASGSAAPPATAPPPLPGRPADSGNGHATPAHGHVDGGGPSHGATTTPPSGTDVVRVASALATVRRTGGAVRVGDLEPLLAVYRRYRNHGLQPVAARGAAIARAFGFEGTIGGIGSRSYRSDHAVGLAIDLMTYRDVATGQALAEFFLAHREELGVTYVIFNGRIASHRQNWAWRPYRHPAGRTDPTAMHIDHPHISFDPADNAYARAALGLATG